MEALVVGGGIVGLNVALALREAGWGVTLVDPQNRRGLAVAMVNPVRGRRGSVVPEAGEALPLAAAVYGRFLPLHRGVRRPVEPELRAKWRRKLEQSQVAHAWREGDVWLPEAFWVEARTLRARMAAGLPRVLGRAVAWGATQVQLAGGRVLRADRVVWAAGAEGASMTGVGGRYSAGSQLLVAEHFPVASAHGVYAASHAVGGSYLPHSERYTPHVTRYGEVAWMLAKARDLLGFSPTPTGVWAGVRWRTEGRYLYQRGGGWVIGGFGSTAYLLAPLYARRLVERLSG
ncbi:MAG TPA: FAD-binding oxidoreductase [Oceanithermus profundus]|uniref:FAD-binding oxidoreductase n=1 Tax=Oceanithermus profundus TaxID=187137 RepID=A0A7C4V5W4_9DEIN|nr:FAD-binding oxidoreductase [Oceanithermus profundus]